MPREWIVFWLACLLLGMLGRAAFDRYCGCAAGLQPPCIERSR